MHQLYITCTIGNNISTTESKSHMTQSRTQAAVSIFSDVGFSHYRMELGAGGTGFFFFFFFSTSNHHQQPLQTLLYYKTGSSCPKIHPVRA